MSDIGSASFLDHKKSYLASKMLDESDGVRSGSSIPPSTGPGLGEKIGANDQFQETVGSKTIRMGIEGEGVNATTKLGGSLEENPFNFLEGNMSPVFQGQLSHEECMSFTNEMTSGKAEMLSIVTQSEAKLGPNTALSSSFGSDGTGHGH